MALDHFGECWTTHCVVPGKSGRFRGGRVVETQGDGCGSMVRRERVHARHWMLGGQHSSSSDRRRTVQENALCTRSWLWHRAHISASHQDLASITQKEHLPTQRQRSSLQRQSGSQGTYRKQRRRNHLERQFRTRDTRRCSGRPSASCVPSRFVCFGSCLDRDEPHGEMTRGVGRILVGTHPRVPERETGG